MSILNEAELDAMRETVGGAAPREAEKVQLANLDHRFRMLVPALEGATARLAERVQAYLTRERKRLTQVAPDAIELLTSAQLSSLLAAPGALCLMQAANGAQVALFLDAALLFEMTERLYGGTSNELAAVKRGPTRVESKVAAKVGQQMTTFIRECSEGLWPELTFLRVVERADHVIEALGEPPVARLAVCEAGQAPMIMVLMPRALLDALDDSTRAKLPAGPTEAFRRALRDELLHAPIEVVVELGQAQVSLAVLSRMAIGDVIRLDRGSSSFLDARTEGLGVFSCRPANAGEQLAGPAAITVEITSDVVAKG